MHVNSRILKLKTLLCDTIPLPDNHKYLLVAGSDSRLVLNQYNQYRCLALVLIGVLRR